MTPTDEQNAVLTAIKRWYAEAAVPELYLAGPAGTGKTSLVALALAELGGRAEVASYTGKAAHVLRRKGVNARTVHSLIYEPVPGSRPVRFRRAEESDLARADLLVLEECFASPTLINTPQGDVKISDLRAGDLMYNACGIDRIRKVFRNQVKHVAKINCRGIEITCSADHRFFTERGEVCARNLRLGEWLVPTREAMRLLRKDFRAEKQPFCEILFEPLRYALEHAISGNQAKNSNRRTWQESWFGSQEISSFWEHGRSRADHQICEYEADATPGGGGERGRDSKEKKELFSAKGWSGSRFDQTAENLASCFGIKMESRVQRRNRFTENTWKADELYHRFSQAGFEDSYRSGRFFSPMEKPTGAGSKEGRFSDWPWVESIEILESSDTRLDRFRDEAGELYFYDLEGTQHHSYSVHGVLVHNCSMIGEREAEDLRSFGVPTLVVGDPYQLPPVNGGGAFTDRRPDLELREVHRQALDSPILRLATRIRLGERWPRRIELPGLSVRPLEGFDDKDLNDPCRQVLCGTHRVRWGYTRHRRGGTEPSYPTAGEPVICRRNNRERALFNGAMGVSVGEARAHHQNLIELNVRLEDETEDRYLWCDPSLFDEHRDQRRCHPEYSRDVDLFDYAYALTVHSAQGSEWPAVTVIDDSPSFREDAARWLYTAITRASEDLTLLLRET